MSADAAPTSRPATAPIPTRGAIATQRVRAAQVRGDARGMRRGAVRATRWSWAARSACSARCSRRAASGSTTIDARADRGRRPRADGSRAHPQVDAPASARSPRTCPDGPFDLVVASEILYYLTRERARARRSRGCASRMAPGGRLVAVHWRPAGPERPLDAERGPRLLRARAWLAPDSAAGADEYLLDVLERPMSDDRSSCSSSAAAPPGFAAAARYREAGGDGAVAIVADEDRMPYHRPPLTKELLRGEIERGRAADRGRGLARRARRAAWSAGRAVALDARARTVRPVGRPRARLRDAACWRPAPSRRGCRCPAPTTRRARAAHPRPPARAAARACPTTRRVVVIGSGFIGCEIAASLRMRGHAVTLVSDEPAPNAAGSASAAARASAAGSRRPASSSRLGARGRADRRAADGLAVHTEARARARGRARRDGDRRGAALRAGARGRRCDRPTDGAIRSTPRCARRCDGVLAAGDVVLARQRRRRPPAARRALGRRARPGRGRGPHRGRRAGAVGRRAGLLVDDRDAHAEARRLGRRLRRRAPRGPRRRRLHRLVRRARAARRRAHPRGRRGLRARRAS